MPTRGREWLSKVMEKQEIERSTNNGQLDFDRCLKSAPFTGNLLFWVNFLIVLKELNYF